MHHDYIKIKWNCVELSPWVHGPLSYKYDICIKISIVVISSQFSTVILYFFSSSYFVYHVLEKLITKYFSYVRENTSGYLLFPFGLSEYLYIQVIFCGCDTFYLPPVKKSEARSQVLRETFSIYIRSEKVTTK